MPPTDPQAELTRRLNRATAEAGQVGRLDGLILQLRLPLFVAAVGLAGLAIRGDVRWGWPVGVAVLFVVVVAQHGRIMARRRRAERIVAFHRRGLQRLDGQWAGQGSAGTRFADENHPYSGDLDLFGVGSLFERLCAARTAGGEAVLAGWLLHPASPAEVARRQGAVLELRDKLDFREDLALLGADVGADVRADSLAAWGAEPTRGVSSIVRLLVLLLALLTVGALVGGVLGLVSPWLVVAALGAEAGTAYGFARHSNRALAGVEDHSAELVTLAGLLARIEAESVTTPPLVALRDRLIGPGASAASAQIAHLAGLVRWVEARHDPYFALFTSVLLWRTQFGFAVAGWREREGARIAGWLAATAELEAYSSLAGYAFENPADPFPEVVDVPLGGLPLLAGTEVGHPLLSSSACVRNSLSLGVDGPDGPRVLAISGSNMSGKSTFLRTVGINAVLAQAGAPVRAKSFRMTPLSIAGTLRVHDSLQEGRSRFYAEVLRLKSLMDLALGQPPLCFLIDEVLHGTNSADRLEGAGAVIRGLIDRGALGLFTTHDLALAEVAGRLGPAVRNVHFADHVGPDGRLAFDYTMRPGVVRQSNALTLMRAVGLEV